ncbi:thrombospondin [Micromonospora sp. CA-263727]|uniref:thrombospondin n=1 Tax=Micromonospora sp. CA-263727 TaxID=3239967 RepID=UPI003D89F421
MRFPSLSRREAPAPAPTSGDDAGRSGAVATEARPTTRPRVDERTDGRTTDRGAAAITPTTSRDRTTGRADAASKAGAERGAVARAVTARSGVDGSRRARTAAPGSAPATDAEPDSRTDRTTNTTDRAPSTDRPSGAHRAPVTGRDTTSEQDRVPAADVPPAPVGPRPRASLLATLGLVVGVAGILFVLTGTLAGYGIAVGAVGAVLAVLGLIATRRRHIAGKADALLGIAIGLGAVVLGVLAMTGQYDWPSTDGDAVARLREWLDSQFVDRI